MSWIRYKKLLDYIVIIIVEPQIPAKIGLLK